MEAAQEDESSAAQERAQQVAGQAQEKAQQVAGQAQAKVREQIGHRSTEAGEKVGSVAEDMRAVGQELRKQGKETPANLAAKAAERAERVGTYLQDSDADALLSDIEDFGRRQPLVVLVGGLALGIAGARFLKASSRRRYEERYGSGAARHHAPSRRLPTRSVYERREPVEPPRADQVPTGTPGTPTDPAPRMTPADPAVR
ncbi:MAG TPA: hypothetical protein VKA41_03985 [Solirubrobacterales bacterium]|nr:hypothetical protein [Solirubrobacterales bacterium]